METTGLVVACGGGGEKWDSSSCFSYNGTYWIQLDPSNPNPSTCYVDSPNLVSEYGWWVTGRRQTGNTTCSDSMMTSEKVLFTGEVWKDGPSLSDGLSEYSCLVQVNSTHSFAAGVTPDTVASEKTWLFNWETDTWEMTDPLIESRYWHGCAELKGKGVLVAGGYADFSPVFSVELFDPQTGSWTPQPGLPQDLTLL